LPNVGFLIVLGLISLLILWSIVDRAARRRASERGVAYLRRLRLAYANQRISRRTDGSIVCDVASLLAIGLFGLDTLTGTPDAVFAKLFRQAASSGGGCGGGCGGGGCGGGGCGGCGG
jgi:hypothetical protein